MMGFQFGFSSYFHQLFKCQKFLTNSPELSAIIAAALGGGFTAVFASPIELIMIQQQLHGGSLVSVVSNIARTYGFNQHGILRGLVANIYRDSVYVSGMLGITPIIQNALLDEFDLSRAHASFYASMIGGMIAAIPSHPFDVIKTCMQGDLEKKKYSSFSNTASLIWSQFQLRGLYKGCMWRTINVLGTVYVANECRNILPNVLFKAS